MSTKRRRAFRDISNSPRSHLFEHKYDGSPRKPTTPKPKRISPKSKSYFSTTRKQEDWKNRDKEDDKNHFDEQKIGSPQNLSSLKYTEEKNGDGGDVSEDVVVRHEVSVLAESKEAEKNTTVDKSHRNGKLPKTSKNRNNEKNNDDDSYSFYSSHSKANRYAILSREDYTRVKDRFSDFLKQLIELAPTRQTKNSERGDLWKLRTYRQHQYREAIGNNKNTSKK
eukprot:g822.t1